MLARRFPQAKIAFTGGDAGILYKSDSEAAGAAALLTALGVPRERLILEANARDTYENAVFLKEELGKAGELGPGARWVLITSAYHMPRAMGSFRAAGFEVEPWPVDYRTRGSADLTRPFDKVSEGLRRVDVAMREWVGLVAYWLTGRSDALFPGAARRVSSPAAIYRSRARAPRRARQHPHVDPILEIGRGAKLGLVLAGEGRHHLAQHAEAHALCRLVPHHGFLGRERLEARHETLAPDEDRLGLRQSDRLDRRRLVLERRTRSRRHWSRR